MVFLFFGWLMRQNFAFVLLWYGGKRFRELLLNVLCLSLELEQ